MKQYKHYQIYHKLSGELYERYGFQGVKALVADKRAAKARGWQSNGMTAAFTRKGANRWENDFLRITRHDRPTGYPLKVVDLDKDPSLLINVLID